MRKVDYVFVVLILLIIGVVVKQHIALNTLTDTTSDVVDILEMNVDFDDTHEETDSLIIANINRIYEYLGIEWEIRPAKRDTVTRRWNPETEKWEEEK